MKKIFFLTVIILFLFADKCCCKHIYPEKYYQNRWCGKWNGRAEYELKDNTRVDCLTTNYAVEFDFAPKWAESFGQATYYGKMTKKKPAIILIIEKPTDWKYYHRVKSICNDSGVTLWYMKSPNYGQANSAKLVNSSELDKNLQYVYAVFKEIVKF